MKIIARAVYIFLSLFAFLAVTWSSLAIVIDGPQNNLGKILAVFFIALNLIGIFLIRPKKLALVFSLFLFAIVCVWWLNIKPQNNRNWMPDVARSPEALFNGDMVTIHNLRNFEYRSETDFTERWEDRTYDLSKVKRFDIFLCYWGSPWMAHAISSWEFTDGKHLAISIETRKEVGEEYSALLGFFRQFELYYVVADESDVVKLRTNFRKEQLYLYHLNDSPEVAKKLLIDYLNEVNVLRSKPRWYNAGTTNCTTTVREQRSHVMKLKPWDWKMLANGYLDELAYSRGQIDTSLPFEELKKQSYINKKAEQSNPLADFSTEIRKK